MTKHARQTIATYAFFEEARTRGRSQEDALLPLVLPFLSEKSGRTFSSEELAKDLDGLFGSDIVIHLAETLKHSLEKEGYITPSTNTAEGVVYLYTDKVLSIQVSDTLSRAQVNIDHIIDALLIFIDSTKSITPKSTDRKYWIEKFVDWATTVDSLDDIDGQSHSSPDDESESIILSAFCNWLSREKPALFESVVSLTEVGLIIDVVKELRAPLPRSRKVQLSVVLDSPILLDLLGLHGQFAHRAATRLVSMCKEHGIQIYTLSHLVQEMHSILYNVLQDPDGFKAGGVNTAIQRNPEIRQIAQRVHGNPDTHVKRAGVTIIPYTQTADANSKRHFGDELMHRFADSLNYDPSASSSRARNDSWSLAYVMRRRNGQYTSNLYESRSVLITHSFSFVNTVKKFIRDNVPDCPIYGVAPVLELRHFSTMFMLNFGMGASRELSRAQLMSSCERVVRLSPGLVKKIRDILKQVGVYSDDQLDEILSDPSMLTELALATDNNPRPVNISNAAALVEVINTAAAHDETIRSMEAMAALKLEHEEEIARVTALAEAAELRESLVQEEKTRLETQLYVLSGQIADDIYRTIKTWWAISIVVMGVICGLSIYDVVEDITNINSVIGVSVSILLAALLAYSVAAALYPHIAPQPLKLKALHAAATRRLRSVPDAELRRRVIVKLQELEPLLVIAPGPARTSGPVSPP